MGDILLFCQHLSPKKDLTVHKVFKPMEIRNRAKN